MSCDPDPIAERSRTIKPEKMEMNDEDSLSKIADIDSDIEEML
jgi:hypothetical protein